MPKLSPLNDYEIVELIEEDDGGVPNPDADDEMLQTGTIVDAGKYAESLAPGTQVYWFRFAGSGQTIEFDGKKLAHIKYEKLMSEVI